MRPASAMLIWECPFAVESHMVAGLRRVTVLCSAGVDAVDMIISFQETRLADMRALP